MVQRYIDSGAVLNRNILKATATGIVKHYKPSALHTISITDSWAKSFLERMNLVKRKGEKTDINYCLMLLNAAGQVLAGRKIKVNCCL